MKEILDELETIRNGLRLMEDCVGIMKSKICCLIDGINDEIDDRRKENHK